MFPTWPGRIPPPTLLDCLLSGVGMSIGPGIARKGYADASGTREPAPAPLLPCASPAWLAMGLATRSPPCCPMLPKRTGGGRPIEPLRTRDDDANCSAAGLVTRNWLVPRPDAVDDPGTLWALLCGLLLRFSKCAIRFVTRGSDSSTSMASPWAWNWACPCPMLAE